ncbi:dCTP deaminase [Patescibacteria group bacterium]
MNLSDRDIKKLLKEGIIGIDPKINFKRQLSGASVDLTLGNEFKIFQHTSIPYIDVNKPKTFENLTKAVKIKDKEPFMLHPNEFVLAITRESIRYPDDIMVRIDGKSSLGRIGIIVHSTAGLVNPGWEGALTLEMTNIGMVPVALYPGMNICQIVFQRLTSPAETSYTKRKTSKYAHQKSPGESKIFQEGGLIKGQAKLKLAKKKRSKRK